MQFLLKFMKWMLWPLAFALALWFVFEDRQKEANLRDSFARVSEATLERKSADVLQSFRFLQVGLRNLALLPGLRDTKAGNTPAKSKNAIESGKISAETRDTVQQFYNNLASLINISEVYMVAKGFDPTKGETPVFMYDELIVDTGAKKASEGENAKGPDDPAEVEDEEYAYYATAMKELEAKHPKFNFKSMSEIPFWVSHPMRTCDNSQYLSKSKDDLRDASGVATIVPLYERTGEFKGIITAVVRMNVFEAALLGTPIVPVTPAEKQLVEKGKIKMPEASRFQLVSKEIGFDLVDRRSVGLRETANSGRAYEAGVAVFSRDLELSSNAKWTLVYFANSIQLEHEISQLRVALFAKVALTLIFAGLLAWGMRQSRQKKTQIEEITQHMERLARGELNEQAVFHGTAEVQNLVRAYARVVNDLSEKSKLAHTISEGDLRIAILSGDGNSGAAMAKDFRMVYAIPSEGDRLGHAMKDMVENLSNIVSLIVQLAQRMEQSSREIASGSNALSQDAVHEAHAVDEVSQMLQSFAAHASESVDLQEKALRLSNGASQKAHDGAPEVHAITTTMRDAQQAGERIGKVVKIIEDIAFQTNLLALNASVEAARAGKAGKGFAVVADEVRNLANRSSNAVHEVESLVDTINAIISQGAGKTDMVEASLQGIVESTVAVASILADVSRASASQKAEIADVSAHMQKLIQATHRNSSLSEELSASAVELRQQAQELHGAVAHFKVFT